MKPILLNKEQYEWAQQRVRELTKESEDNLLEKLETPDHRRRQQLGHQVRVLIKQIEDLNEQIKEYEK